MASDTLPDAPKPANPFDRRPIPLFGLPFDPVTLTEAHQAMRRAGQEKRRLFISTANLDWIVMARQDRAFANSIVRSDLVTADGMPLIKLAALAGTPLPERVTGADLFQRLAQEPADPKLSVYFYGGKDDSAVRASAAMADAQGVTPAGGSNPGFGTLDDFGHPDRIAALNAAAADFLLVALSAKKGQLFLDQNRHRLTSPILAHFGAVVDFAAGNVARAPEAFQKTGLEWAWRIGQDPGLWRRYAGDAALLPRLTVEAVKQRRAFAAMENVTAAAAGRQEEGRFIAQGVASTTRTDALASYLTAQFSAGDPAQVIFGEDSAMAPEDLGLLILANRHFADAGSALYCIALPPSTRVVLNLNGLMPRLALGDEFGLNVAREKPGSPPPDADEKGISP